LVLSGILLQICSSAIIFANYEINKEKITEQFCENKDKPKMCCKGKCHMRKQLNEAEKKENAPANNIKEKIEIQLFSENNSATEFHYSFILIKHNSFYLVSESSTHLLSVFHPPSYFS
jgi:hypothetical protein